jgi:hypothetical protein
VDSFPVIRAMLKRLFLGIVIGVIIGGAAAFGLVRGLGMTEYGEGAGLLLAYGTVVGVGLLTGLVAGKPIWSRDGKLAAGLKAFFGAALASAFYFALRRWGQVPVDLSQLGAGHGNLGDLPATALPIVAGALGGIFELDNTPSSDDKGAKGSGKRVATNTRVAELADDEDGEAEAAPRARRKR